MSSRETAAPASKDAFTAPGVTSVSIDSVVTVDDVDDDVDDDVAVVDEECTSGVTAIPRCTLLVGVEMLNGYSLSPSPLREQSRSEGDIVSEKEDTAGTGICK